MCHHCPRHGIHLGPGSPVQPLDEPGHEFRNLRMLGRLVRIHADLALPVFAGRIAAIVDVSCQNLVKLADQRFCKLRADVLLEHVLNAHEQVVGGAGFHLFLSSRTGQDRQTFRRGYDLIHLFVCEVNSLNAGCAAHGAHDIQSVQPFLCRRSKRNAGNRAGRDVNRLGHPDDVRGVLNCQVEIDVPLKHGTLLEMGAWTIAHTDIVADIVHNSLHDDARVHAVSGKTSMDTTVDSVHAVVHQTDDLSPLVPRVGRSGVRRLGGGVGCCLGGRR